ncbi:glutamate-rich protein 6B [Mantella aurantiaca]
MDNKSKDLRQEQVASQSTLTVENVTKLELQYGSQDGDLLERRKVEEYIRKTQQFEQQKRSESSSHPTLQPEDFKDSRTSTAKDSSIEDLVTSKSILERKSVDLADGEDTGSEEITLNVEEYLQKEAIEDLVSCDFCLKPKKPFPSVEQLISEPSSMLFCCVKSQELFQFMIEDAIKTYTPEETNGRNEILKKEPQDKNEVKEKEFEDKYSDNSPLTPHNTDEIKALISLREELEKVNMKDYINSLSNHMISYGSLFVTQKIGFSLESAPDSIAYMQSADIDFHLTPKIDDFFCPVLNNRPVKQMPEKTVCEFYNSGSSFLIHFTDGTGQVLYPSGNIGILIARSKSTQLTFIIMEDTKHKPLIQAVFMSNGHAACYHLNGSLRAVLDPCGGVCFDENGIQQKQWAWWDLSQHVHAPPFQPITFKLNANIEVKMLTQDRIFLTFTREKEKVSFNVGSKLMLKDPDSLSQLKSRTADAECYLCTKHLQISILLNNIRDLLRISHSSHRTMKTMQEFVKQLQQSLDYITGLASKLSDSAEKQKNKSIRQNVTAAKKKHRPHRTPSLKIECNVVENKGRRKGNSE